MVLQAWPSVAGDGRKTVFFGKRHVLALMAFTGLSLAYSIRFNLSIVIVVMVNSTKPVDPLDPIGGLSVGSNSSNTNGSNSVTEGGSCPKRDTDQWIGDRRSHSGGELHWNERTVGVVLGSFFWGYATTMFPGGLLSQRFGGKWPFGLAQLGSALAGLLIPASPSAGPYFLTGIRIIQGLVGGVSITAIHVLIANWIPPKERGKFANFIYAGMPFGSAATLLVSGNIAYYLGWPAVFYVTGVITIVWSALWFWLIYDTPATHPTISDVELRQIELSLSSQHLLNTKHLKTPWGDIFTSIPVWAILICQPTSTWGYYTLLILTPTYLKTILHFDLQSSSWISACPHAMSWFMSMCITQICDILQTLSGSAICMLSVAFAGCNAPIAVVLLILACGCNGAIFGGVLCSHIDIAPNYAGILFGLGNTLATLPGFLSPSIAGYILQGNASVGQWQKIFALGAAIHFVGNLVFLIFGSAEVQYWNNGKGRSATRQSPDVAIDVKT